MIRVLRAILGLSLSAVRKLSASPLTHALRQLLECGEDRSYVLLFPFGMGRGLARQGKRRHLVARALQDLADFPSAFARSSLVACKTRLES